ncbi:sensor histidine kinase [Streptococcus sp. FSL R7-0212]|uniref:sensor histidine kinase n=1 Tax=Streptococcus sp. FSL R7-0212 TaxID=2921726 RepID=UPI0030FAABF0
MRPKLSLWASISLIFISIIAMTTVIFYSIMIGETYQSIKHQETHLLTATGKMLAKNKGIKQVLTDNVPNEDINQFTVDISKTYKLDYVVAMNMNGIRLTHPNLEKIGKPFQGGDENQVLKGKEVISTARGSLGKSLRYLIPVYNGKKQIGALAVGIKLTTLNQVVFQSKKNYTTALIFCILISLAVASATSIKLKKQLHNLEPSEIYQLLEERNAMLDQIEDAVLVINKNRMIQLTNQSGKELIKDYDIKNVSRKRIEEIFPEFTNIKYDITHEQLLHVNDTDLLLKVSQIQVNHELRGYLIFIREASEAIYTLDQLMYTTTYASALQAQTHTFMNQLHVIYGLVDIQYYDQLKIYLNSILESEDGIVNTLSVLVKEPLLASFFIGEQGKYKELNTDFVIEAISEIPNALSNNQINKALMLYQFIHTHIISALNPEKVLLTIDYNNGYLISTYQLLDKSITNDTILEILNNQFFRHLLSDTNSIYSKQIDQDELTFSMTTPYRRG